MLLHIIALALKSRPDSTQPRVSKSKRITNNSLMVYGKVEIQIRQTAYVQTEEYKMRDLYNGANKPTYWLNRLNIDLDG
jgi:hypothetical protein